MIAVEDLPELYIAYRTRYHERDDRMHIMDDIVRGEFSSVNPDDEAITPRAPNLIQIALEDTAEAAAIVPTIRVIPAGVTQAAKKQANTMERVAVSYLDLSEIDMLIPQTVMDIGAFGFGVWLVWPNVDLGSPKIEKRDPRTCYPEPGYRPGDDVKRCIFARDVRYSQLPPEYKAKLSFLAERDRSPFAQNNEVTLIEYFDCHEYVVAGLYKAAGRLNYGNDASSYIPVELDRIPNPTGVCPVVLGSKWSLDGEFRGQYDQVVGMLEALMRLMDLVLDYSDQAVYSDIWVRDLVGEMPFGGGAYIELGPQGAIGRVPPAVSSLNVQADIERLMDGIHLGGRWPKARPGEVDQSIASAKFIESSVGVMNTVIKSMHTILKRMIEKALRVSFATDKAFFPGTKTASGVLRNQEFLLEYDTKDIDLKHKIKAEYGLGFGRDPSQSAVLTIQFAQNEFISHETAQETVDGITDVDRERRRIDVQKFREMALARLLEGLQAKTIPDEALIDIAKARLNGDDLFDLYQKFVVEPQKQQMEQGLMSGLDGGMLPPGAPPGMPAEGMPVPGGPAGPPGVPTPPDPVGMISRLTSQLPGRGGFIGTQVQE